MLFCFEAILVVSLEVWVSDQATREIVIVKKYIFTWRFGEVILKYDVKISEVGWIP